MPSDSRLDGMETVDPTGPGELVGNGTACPPRRMTVSELGIVVIPGFYVSMCHGLSKCRLKGRDR